jgi:hypothetical protein
VSLLQSTFTTAPTHTPPHQTHTDLSHFSSSPPSPGEINTQGNNLVIQKTTIYMTTQKQYLCLYKNFSSSPPSPGKIHAQAISSVKQCSNKAIYTTIQKRSITSAFCASPLAFLVLSLCPCKPNINPDPFWDTPTRQAQRQAHIPYTLQALHSFFPPDPLPMQASFLRLTRSRHLFCLKIVYTVLILLHCSPSPLQASHPDPSHSQPPYSLDHL